MSVLDDACRIGRFAVLDARYGHYRDRYYRAVPLAGADLERAPHWCVFARATHDASYAPDLPGVARPLAVESVKHDDAHFVATPWFAPLNDVLHAGNAQGVVLDDALGIAILRTVCGALAVDDPPRLPFVDATTVGIDVTGAVTFFGWRPFTPDGQSEDVDNPARVWRELRTLSMRLLGQGSAQRRAIVSALSAHHVPDDDEQTPAYRAEPYEGMRMAIERAASSAGLPLDDDANTQWLGDIVRGLFAERLREHAELEEELAMVPVDELRALPPPK